jgi:hypothetical protein
VRQPLYVKRIVLNFFIFLVASLALILGILLDVRWTALARNALEGLFAWNVTIHLKRLVGRVVDVEVVNVPGPTPFLRVILALEVR